MLKGHSHTLHGEPVDINTRALLNEETWRSTLDFRYVERVVMTWRAGISFHITERRGRRLVKGIARPTGKAVFILHVTCWDSEGKNPKFYRTEHTTLAQAERETLNW